MFSALTGKKIDPDKAKQAIALVTVHSGEVNVHQLVDSFRKMFQWGWEWKAGPYLNNSFLVKFPSIQKIEELKGYEYFGLPGLNSAVKVSKWDNAAMVKYRLYVVWVRVSGIPESLQHYHGICEAASLIGTVKEVDMKTFRQSGSVRVKMGVKDPRKIPALAPLNDDDFIYDIWFELEDIVEHGGPMMGGALVVNPMPDTQSKFVGSSSGVSNIASGNGQVDIPVGNLQCQGEVTGVSQHAGQVSEAEEVISSQYELDMQLQAELAAKKLAEAAFLSKKKTSESGQFGSVHEKSSQQLHSPLEEERDEEEIDFNCSADPNNFARKVGLCTQRIREIDQQIDIEDRDKENCAPVSGDTNNAFGVSFDRDKVTMEASKSRAKAQERIRKAKAKADTDEAAIRSSVRNKKNEDVHAMDRCEDMARKRNLEPAPEKRASRNAAAGG